MDNELRAKLISDAAFLMSKASNLLRLALQDYPNLSSDSEFDESRDVGYSLRFLEMAEMEIEQGGYDLPASKRVNN